MADSAVSMKDIIWAIISFAFNVLLVVTVVSVITIIPEEEWVQANAPEFLMRIFAVVRRIGLFVWNLMGR